MREAARGALPELIRHRDALQPHHLRDLFTKDPRRFERFSLVLGDLTLDYSENRVTAETVALLVRLAEAAGVEDLRNEMFSGKAINVTERRAVGHAALRDRSGRPFSVLDEDVMPAVRAVLDRIRAFAEGVRSGAIRGVSGKRFTDIVNIGIGGSDLGPAMATAALAPYRAGGPCVQFVSNVDGAHLSDTLAELTPETTLILIASKTFTTSETMTNAESARRWLTDELGEAAVANHFAAISTALDKVFAFGIAEDRVFGFWDWVGGRYSVWSAVGLPLAISVGFENFEAFLAGAHEMDVHFRTSPLTRNMPALLALLGIWHRNVCDMRSHAVLPYDQRLHRFTAYLQQLEMESNGKCVTRDGWPVDYETGPVVWGEPGTNGQYAFFQLLHQGTDVVPCDFLLAAEPHEELSDHHAKLVANCLAQSEALAFGRTEEEARSELIAQGIAADEVDRLAPHKAFPGNRPSNTLLYRKLDPSTLGRLIALYEHKVFVQGAVWDINSFDQWGVELGKALAGRLLPVIRDGAPADELDPSTRGLVECYRALQGGILDDAKLACTPSAS